MRTEHGMTNTRLMNIWKNMKQRCNNPKNPAYNNYGAKGIKVCKEWEESSAEFFKWALSNGYTDDLTIDRIDSTGNYEPSNCRWIPLSENSRRPHVGRKGNNGGGHFFPITYNGKTQTIKEWAKELGINYTTLHKRIRTNGWSVEKAFNTKIQRRATKQ